MDRRQGGAAAVASCDAKHEKPAIRCVAMTTAGPTGNRANPEKFHVDFLRLDNLLRNLLRKLLHRPRALPSGLP